MRHYSVRPYVVLLCLFVLFACQKENSKTPTAKAEAVQQVKEALLKNPLYKQLTKNFNDSLVTVYKPDWESVRTDQKNDSLTIYSIPLFPTLYSVNGNKLYRLNERNYRKFLLANKVGNEISFSFATVIDSDSSSKGSRKDRINTVFFDDGNQHHSKIDFDKNGWRTGNKSLNNAKGASTNGSPDQVCYYICNWGYYCIGTGYTATITMGLNFCSEPNIPTGECPNGLDLMYSAQNPYAKPVWYLGNYTYDCTSQHEPGWEPSATPDPTVFAPMGGSYNANNYTVTNPPIAGTTNNYYNICASNFSFVSVTTDDIWQEACITNIYCNMVASYPANTVVVRIPQLYFGLPWYNIDGKVVFTRSDATLMCQDALNYGEYRMYKSFSNNTSLTATDLETIWIRETQNQLTKMTRGLGRAARTGSQNVTTPVPKRIYITCNPY